MEIRRLEISAFRRFRDKVVIDDIGRGVTLTVGDNEEGKSTVLAALQTVLFEKHSVGGAVADAMLPFGSKVRPEITLEFEHNGERYSLIKGFCQKPAAELRADSGGRWTDDAAEEMLREMLEFTPPSKGGTKAEHRGLQALFWVEQGSAFGQPHINETAQSSLAGALESEVGTVTGGERGRTLLKRIEERLNGSFTQKTRRPAGAYARAIDAAARAKEKYEGLAGKLKNLEGRIDALTRERELLASLEADDPVGAAEERVVQAHAALRKVEGLEGDLRTAEVILKAARSQFKLATTRLETRQSARKAADRAEQDVIGLETDAGTARASLATLQRACSATAEAYESASAALVAADNKAMAARRLVHRLRAQDELGKAREALDKAEAAEREATHLSAQVEANSLMPKVLETLRRLDEDARGKAALLKGAATHVELMPEPGRCARLKGEPIESDAMTLVASTEIGLDGFGSIRVTPGGKDLAAHQQAARDSTAKLTAELSRHGVVDLQDAVKSAGDRATWVNEATIHRATVQLYAPKGLESLRGDVARLAADMEQLEAAPGPALDPGISMEVAVREAEESEREQADARTDERAASDARKDADTLLGTARTALSTVEDQHGEAQKEALALRAALEARVAEESDQDLQQAVDDAAAAEQKASSEVDNIRNALVEGDATGARAELKAATDARRRVEENLDGKRRSVRDLEIELRALGNDDLAAENEVAEGELARAEALKNRLEHEAASLKLLHDTLVDQERSARETFLAPVRDRMAPYLKRLFPDSELMLDDQSLEITHLRRGGQDEPYEKLSIGTREQLAVLARLAFADLLDEHGKKSPIILDDALVFSDDGRFRKMQDILDRAAERLQIIVLTCHERAYFTRGWTTRRLEEAKPATATGPARS